MSQHHSDSEEIVGTIEFSNPRDGFSDVNTRSAVYNFFKPSVMVEGRNVRGCKSCKSFLMNKSSVLKTHLKSSHADEYSKMRGEEAERKKNRHSIKSSKINKSLQDHKRQKQSPSKDSKALQHLPHNSLANQTESTYSSCCSVCHQMFRFSSVDCAATLKNDKKTVQELFGEFMSQAELDSVAVCQDCKFEIDAFRKLTAKAMAIKKKLIEKFNFVMSKPFDGEENLEIESVQIKTEEDSDEMSMMDEIPISIKIETFEAFEEPNCAQVEAPSFDVFQTLPEVKIKKRTKEKVCDCPICGKRYDSMWKLNSHQKIHITETNCECPICNKRFKTQSYVNRHLKLHDETPKFFCDSCGSNFKTKTSLRNHIKRNHSLTRDFLCFQCPKAYPNLTELRNHLLTHSDVKKECCATCGDRFYTKEKLKRHERTHSSVRDFKCPICCKEFRQRYNMTAHVKTVHLKQNEWKQNKFECSICGSKFDRKAKLNKHLSTVHGVVDGEGNLNDVLEPS